MPTPVSDSADGYAQVHWLIRLRWVAVFGVTTAVILTGPIFHLVPTYRLLLVTSGLFALWNLSLQLLNQRKAWVQPAATQVALDLLFLGTLLLLSGGIRNPFSVFLVVQVILGAMLLPLRPALWVGGLAGLVVLALSSLEVAGIIPLKAAPAGVAASSEGSLLSLWGVSSALLITIGVAMHFTTTIMEDLRSRIRETHASRIQLQRAEKLAALGRLSTGIAHEIATPLGSVEILASEAQAVMRECDNEEARDEVMGYMRDVRQEVTRVSSLVRQLLDLGHPKDEGPEAVDLCALADEAIALVSHRGHAPRTEIRVEWPEESARAFIPRDRVRQVIINLLANALDATSETGRITVRLRGGPPGFLMLEIEDDGEGIPAEDLERIFDPFFTTKDVGMGTGLGLYVSYEIMRNLGGDITISSHEGAGTLARIVLPAEGTDPAARP